MNQKRRRKTQGSGRSSALGDPPTPFGALPNHIGLLVDSEGKIISNEPGNWPYKGQLLAEKAMPILHSCLATNRAVG